MAAAGAITTRMAPLTSTGKSAPTAAAASSGMASTRPTPPRTGLGCCLCNSRSLCPRCASAVVGDFTFCAPASAAAAAAALASTAAAIRTSWCFSCLTSPWRRLRSSCQAVVAASWSASLRRNDSTSARMTSHCACITRPPRKRWISSVCSCCCVRSCSTKASSAPACAMTNSCAATTPTCTSCKAGPRSLRSAWPWTCAGDTVSSVSRAWAWLDPVSCAWASTALRKPSM
mmetsp:Transcript_16608/g.38979  ORF Transcript_16608/g.38979 Transcript_16608/m.38979 type:complete len:231 (-) Transcript_16608:604-1296(-)